MRLLTRRRPRRGPDAAASGLVSGPGAVRTARPGTGDDWPAATCARRDRTHQAPRRSRRLMLRYDDAEYAADAAAAAKTGLTPTGYAAQVALAAATETTPPVAEPLREALAELMAARTQVRKFGVNVNQAVRESSTPPAPLPNGWTERSN